MLITLKIKKKAYCSGNVKSIKTKRNAYYSENAELITKKGKSCHD